ncbi:ABC transporter permease [Kutzneria kofuensis]|uniref:ABC-2 type transport system permease protein n=1 Tax=Kutzneria kofuensis TaxID=103725 RepID=A0A7W9KIX5_9PSEU|nr:ABC-2 family transporter protein [Kutzneria kofuensis]MBB5893399.1 ABC-2 type transport system permease protein [Kutzneria kofuensis]
MCAVIGCYLRITLAGFHRFSTYRQAVVAGTATNIVFGLIKVGILTAVYVARDGAPIGGYDLTTTITYVWLGQGLLGVVDFWGDDELAERIRSGDVVVDLSRPWNLQAALLCGDLGRAGFGLVARFIPQLALGALFFPFRWPGDPWVVWPAFLISTACAVLVSFHIRFLLHLTSFWLLDSRGVINLYRIVGATLAGLEVPLSYFPDWAQAVLVFTPFPAMLQDPINVFVQVGSLPLTLAHQLLWVALLAAAGRLLLDGAVRKVVVQGG